MTTRADLERALSHRDARMEALKAEYPDAGDFWYAFANMADVILRVAGSEDYDWVSRRTDEILREHGVGSLPGSP